jgi:valyl-tRNA synthetase
VPPGARLALHQQGANATTKGRLERHREAIQRLARLSDIVVEERPTPAQALAVVIDEATFSLPVGGVIDLEAEAARLEREIAKLDAEAAKLEQQLANPDFVARAPAEVVERQRERLEEIRSLRERLLRALKRIR